MAERPRWAAVQCLRPSLRKAENEVQGRVRVEILRETVRESYRRWIHAHMVYGMGKPVLRGPSFLGIEITGTWKWPGVLKGGRTWMI